MRLREWVFGMCQTLMSIDECIGEARFAFAAPPFAAFLQLQIALTSVRQRAKGD